MSEYIFLSPVLVALLVLLVYYLVTPRTSERYIKRNSKIQVIVFSNKEHCVIKVDKYYLKSFDLFNGIVLCTEPCVKNLHSDTQAKLQQIVDYVYSVRGYVIPVTYTYLGEERC